MREFGNIGVSIVAYKHSFEELSAVIESAAQCDDVRDIWIVDNASDATLRQAVLDRGLRYIDPGKNLGYGRAHNLAIRESVRRNTYHVILNPDVAFSPETLTKLGTFLDQNADVSLAMPKILYEDGSIQRLCKKLPTPKDLILRRFAPSFLRQRLQQTIAKYELQHLDYDVPFEPPSLSGCFMFFRSADLDAVGGFDERFFMYFEDFDLVRRARSVGRAVYYPYVHAYHGYGKGSYHHPRLLLYHMQSAVLYFSKWGWFRDKERAHLNQKIEWFPESAMDLTYDVTAAPRKPYAHNEAAYER